MKEQRVHFPWPGIFNACAREMVKNLRSGKMEERVKAWLEQELGEYSKAMKEFNRKLTRMMYLAMAGSVVGLTALGFYVGGDAATVFTLHFPIGCGIALIIWLCFYIQVKVTSGKKVRAAYEKAIGQAFHSQEDENIFIHQMENHDYGTVNFMNTVVDKYPCRFLAGPDYLMYFRDLNCFFIRTADIRSTYAQEEKTRLRYHMGDYHIMQNVAMGISLMIDYKEGSVSAKERNSDNIYLENGRQLTQVLDLIRKHCPVSSEFMAQ